MIKRGWLCGLVSAVLLLAACGMAQAEDYVEENYTFVDAVAGSSSNDRAMMYRSEQSLSDTATELSGVQEPEQIGEVVEGRQVLVYDDEFIILTEDPDNAGTTLVEVAGDEFVRNTYHPGFFTGMFVGSFLSNRFGNTWVSTQGNRCSRGGCYSGGGSYASFPSTSTYGRGSNFRGGGPGVGK
ncbi:DUF4247 domain-containing protein [Planococcus sp. YIM B11945]|uniref:DUF4247 domain-containing protein n=1 Tax=Planococcus sp. YIM B11945 TaxID=3435410 RepID=UPI003D7E9B94